MDNIFYFTTNRQYHQIMNHNVNLLIDAVPQKKFIIMLLIVWQGLRLRGEGWEHFGLRFGVPTRSTLIRALGLSVVVFVGAVPGFGVGAIIGANLFGMPDQSDMS